MSRKNTPAAQKFVDGAFMHLKGMAPLDMSTLGLTTGNVQLAMIRGMGTDVLSRPSCQDILTVLKPFAKELVEDDYIIVTKDGRTDRVTVKGLIARLEVSDKMYHAALAALGSFKDPVVNVVKGTGTKGATKPAAVDGAAALRALIDARKGKGKPAPAAPAATEATNA